MKTYETTTNIAYLVSVGTYYGPFEYDSIWGEDERCERDEGNFVCDDYDFQKFKNAILKEVNAIFKDEKPMESYGVALVRATDMKSPKEYNFGDDWLDLATSFSSLSLSRRAKDCMTLYSFIAASVTSTATGIGSDFTESYTELKAK